MQYLICYDISEDRRRERCASTLLDFGRRLQESVFLAVLEKPLIDDLLQRLRKVIEPELDNCHVFPLCEVCAGKMISLTDEAPPEPKEFYIV